jgi:hypothetical protein
MVSSIPIRNPRLFIVRFRTAPQENAASGMAFRTIATIHFETDS